MRWCHSNVGSRALVPQIVPVPHSMGGFSCVGGGIFSLPTRDVACDHGVRSSSHASLSLRISLCMGCSSSNEEFCTKLVGTDRASTKTSGQSSAIGFELSSAIGFELSWIQLAQRIGCLVPPFPWPVLVLAACCCIGR